MQARVLASGLLLFVMAACGSVDEDDFITRLAVAECRTVDRCAQGLFEATFSDMDDCVDEFAESLEESLEDLDKCDYDPEEARRCVSRVKSMGCADWARGDDERACDLVYDCTE